MLMCAQRLYYSAAHETRPPPLQQIKQQEPKSIPTLILWQQGAQDEVDAAPLPDRLDELWHFCSIVSPLPRSRPASACSSPAAYNSPPASPPPFLLTAHVDQSHGAARADDQRHAILHRVFNTFDQNRDGLVSTQEIVAIFQKLGIPAQNERSIQSLLARLVTKTAAHVDEQEFCLLYDSVCENNITLAEPNSSSACCVDVDEDEDLRAAFNVFDKDGNGLISPMELQSVLCSLGFPQAQQLDACVEMIARVDDNADGHVDFFEFKKLFYLENSNVLVSSN